MPPKILPMNRAGALTPALSHPILQGSGFQSEGESSSAISATAAFRRSSLCQCRRESESPCSTIALFRAGAITALLTVLVGSELQALAASPDAGLERFYVGTYAGTIYKSSLNLGSTTFGTISQAAGTTDPSFVALTPNRAFLYSVNENPGTVSAFSVNATNGNLSLLNQVSSNGGAPAYILVDTSGRNVLVANYNGGSVPVFPIQTNGRLSTATSHIQHPGTSPHPHCITIDASNHFAFVCDKGLDQIRAYVFDPVAGTLTTNTTLITFVAAGSGPRHMAFDP